MSTTPGQEPGGRAPRRIVLLTGSDDADPVETVLQEYTGDQISGTRLHADLQQFSAAHPGRRIAAEWLGPLGWTRFLWCRKG